MRPSTWRERVLQIRGGGLIGKRRSPQREAVAPVTKCNVRETGLGGGGHVCSSPLLLFIGLFLRD